ncbi:phosphate ABC transporter substrate-binding protein [Halomonas almeriensis]|uniref:phosphate ABC transporter substrate-binding protein n=1 Tax=Halomonas almeriensis TaxID=308163 RepID=UPI0025B53852|nr:phosphate ABC transporter substrate-binding protein [Halomonas almeriensis]MDN3552544.1 phosphate ABC transporter substrate-binding protein [Halomonas almeriensis]
MSVANAVRACLGLLMLLSAFAASSLWVSVAQAEEAGTQAPVGTLDTVGSDTMAGLMLRWDEHLAREHPGMRLQLKASGSASAPPALTAGTTLLGPMSRPMTDDERAAFERRHGYPVESLVVARDALVVVVHRHNPLTSLSFVELDAIFSETRRCGGEAGLRRWSSLLDGTFQGLIAPHGRNAVSGTHELFRREALCNGAFRPQVREHPGSAAVVSAVSADPRGIGYAGLNHLTPGVKTVALRDAQGVEHRPQPEAVQRGDYPFSRDLRLYVNRPPDEPLPAVERAFIDLLLSPEGQAIAEEMGFVALPRAVLDRQRRRLGLVPLSPP